MTLNNLPGIFFAVERLQLLRAIHSLVLIYFPANVNAVPFPGQTLLSGFGIAAMGHFAQK
jgi:hypothetical protein